MKLSNLLVVCLVMMSVAVTAQAQQITGTPGSPDATTTIDGRYLPTPRPSLARWSVIPTPGLGIKPQTAGA
jgi:hypothetical protein